MKLRSQLTMMFISLTIPKVSGHWGNGTFELAIGQVQFISGALPSKPACAKPKGVGPVPLGRGLRELGSGD
jgi:hypothetical protein